MKIEYYYLKVPAGEGVYAWNDYNGDGMNTRRIRACCFSKTQLVHQGYT